VTNKGYLLTYLLQTDHASTFMVDRVKIFLTKTLHYWSRILLKSNILCRSYDNVYRRLLFSWTQCSLIKQNLVVVSDTVLAHVARSHNFGGCGPTHYERNWPPRNKLLHHMCYRTKFGCYTSNLLGVIVETRQKISTPSVSPFKVTQGHWNRQRSIGYL